MEETIRRLGVARTTVIGLTKDGRLLPVKLKGKIHYSEQQVDVEMTRRQESNKILRRDRLPAPVPLTGGKIARPTPPPLPSSPSYDGKLAAAAVEEMDKGAGVRELVKKLAIPFELAEHLVSSYRRAGRETEMVVGERFIKEWRATFDWSEHLPTPGGLMAAIQRSRGSLETRVKDEVEKLRNDLYQQLLDEMVPGPPRIRVTPAGRCFVSVWFRDADGNDRSRRIDITSLCQLTPPEIEFALPYQPPPFDSSQHTVSSKK
jgi:hypothetical protein